MAIAELLIRLKDQASGGIGRIGSAFRGLGDRARDASIDTKGLTGSFRDALLQVNALEFGLNKINQAVGFLNGKFQESTNLQLEQINQVSTLSSLIGVSSEEAGRFIDSFNVRLAKSAATLPGVTGDYLALSSAITDNVVSAFQDASGKVQDMKGFEDTLASLSESFGAKTAASTRDIGNTALGLSKALSGASLSELKQIAFFEQNPEIIGELEKRLASMGKELKDLDVASRVKLLQEVGEKFITTDFKEAASNSIDGLIQNFNTALFDPRSGLFGLMNDLDVNTEGSQSAFAAMNEALAQMIGPDGFVFGFAGLLTDAGLKFPHPMQLLRDGVLFFVKGLEKVNEGITFARDFVKAGGSLMDAFKVATSRIFTPSAINPQGLMKTITGFLGDISRRVGPMLMAVADMAGPLFNQGVGMISQFFADPRQMYAIGVAFGGLIGKINGNIIRFLSQVDYPQLLVGIGRIAIGIGAALLGAIGGWGIEIGIGIWSALQNIGPMAVTAFGVIVDAWQQTLVDGLNGIGGMVIGVLSRIPLIGGVLAAIATTQIGAIKSFLEGGLTGLMNYIKQGFVGLIQALVTKVTGLMDQARNIPLIGGLVPTLSPPAAASPAGAIASRYSGQVENAAGGFLGNLLGAARRELGNMPGGSSLVMANSSETILPEGILGELIRGVAGLVATPPAITPQINLQTPAPAPVAAIAPTTPAAPQGQPLSITIANLNVQASGDSVRAIAQTTLAEIQAMFDAELKATFG